MKLYYREPNGVWKRKCAYVENRSGLITAKPINYDNEEELQKTVQRCTELGYETKIVK